MWQSVKHFDWKEVLKTVVKEEYTGKQHFILFPQYFLYLANTDIFILAKLNLFSFHNNICPVTNNFFWSKFVSFTCFELNPLPTITTFNDPGNEAFLSTLWEKEKMLVTRIFSFFHNVFYPFQNKFQFSIHIYFVICKCVHFGTV